MYKTESSLIERCRVLRRRGFTLGEITKIAELPKTTIYGHVRNIVLPPEGQKRLRETQGRIAEENTKKINEFNTRERKGRCAPGRIILKPGGWSNGLIFLVAHFMFDGEVQSRSCIYHNRNEFLIRRVKFLMKKIFSLQSRDSLNRDTGVHRISYHYVELADYARKKIQELKKYIKDASLIEKEIFLRVFFDDEGSVHFYRRLVRGYQHNLEILQLIHQLLKDIGIDSKIDKKYKEITISKKENLVKFRNKVNFSKGIYINPDRKNSIWKQKIEKRGILNRAINSYIK